MDKRLKIITIITGLVFAISVIAGFYHDFIPGFRVGFNEGWETEDNRIEARSSGLSPIVVRTFHLSLEPEGGSGTFPTRTLATTKHNQLPLKAEISGMRVRVTYIEEDVPRRAVVISNLAFWLILPILYIFVLIPVQVFRIVRSITKSKVFEFKNIKRLRHIGYALLSFYVVDLVFIFSSFRLVSHIVQVEGYSLQMGLGNITIIFLGFVILMFAEVLKISTQLKEEQDLTV